MVFSVGRVRDADPGDLVGVLESVSLVVASLGAKTARDCSDEDPRADTVRVSLPVTVLGGDGFILTDEVPRTRLTSG